MYGYHDVEVVFELVQETLTGALSVNGQGPFPSRELWLSEEAFLRWICVLTHFG